MLSFLVYIAFFFETPALPRGMKEIEILLKCASVYDLLWYIDFKIESGNQENYVYWKKKRCALNQ